MEERTSGSGMPPRPPRQAQLQPLASASSSMSSAIVGRKLGALGYEYEEGMLQDGASVQLIGSLLSDLLHTTEAYRDAKSKDTEAARGAAEWAEQRDALRLENSKLVRENNRLHRQLVEDKERRDISDREDGRRVKDAEEEMARLTFWKQQQADRQRQVEEENSVLRGKIDDLLSKASKTSELGGDSVKLDVEPTKIIVSGPLNSEPRDPSSSSLGAPPFSVALPADADRIVKQANDRAMAAETLSRSLQSEVKSLHEAIEVAASSLELREKEIERLSTLVEVEGGSLTKLAAEHKSEVNERLVSSLNKQVDFLTEQLANAQEAAHYRFQLEEKLGQTQKTLAIAEADVQALKSRVEEFGEEKMRRDREDESNPKAKVIEGLERELQESKSALDDAKKQASELVSQREAAILQYKEAEAKLIEVEVTLRHMRDAMDVQTTSMERMASERDAALQARDAFRESAERSASSRQTTADELRLAQEKVGIAERSVKDSQEAIQKSRAEASQAILIARDANDKRVNAESASRAAAVECELLNKQLSVIKNELAAARENLESDAAAKAVSDGELHQIRGERDVLRAEKAAIESELKDTMSRLSEQAAHAAAASLSEEKLAMMMRQIETYQDKLNDLNETVGGHAAKAAAAEADASKHQIAADQALERQRQLEELLETCTGDRDALQARCIDLEFQMKAALTRVADVEQTEGNANAARENAITELSSLKDTVRSLESRLSKVNSEHSEAQTRAIYLEAEKKRLADENIVLSSRLKTLNETTDAAHAAELHAASDTASVREELRNVVASREAARKEAAEAVSRATHSEKRAADAEMRADLLVKEVTERTRDINRLKTLISSLDGTRQELVNKIESLSMDAKAHQQQIENANQKLSSAMQESRDARDECAKLATSLSASAAECDRLQNELDSQSEEIATGKSALDDERVKADTIRQALSAAESRAARGDRALDEAHASIAAMRAEQSALESELSKLRAENRGRSEELYALTDDLSSMTREQQIVNAELLREKNEKERLHAELARASEAAEAAASHLRLKDNEMEELIVAYQELGTENRRLDHGIVNLERELQECQSTLRHRESAVESVRKQVREVEDENRRYVIDLQAFERQVDSLSRQLATSDERQNDLSEGKTSAISNLGNAQQVILELERTRENLQRELAAVSARLDVSNERVSTTVKEKNNLLGQLRSEKERSAGLDELVGNLRMREHAESIPPLQGTPYALGESKDIRQLELKVAQLQATLRDKEGELSALRSRLAPSTSVEMADSVSGEEKERLLGLLGKMDAERAQLQRENAELARQVNEIGRASGTVAGVDSVDDGGPVSMGDFKKMQFVKEQLEAALDKAHKELNSTRNEMSILQGEYNALFETSDNEEE